MVVMFELLASADTAVTRARVKVVMYDVSEEKRRKLPAKNAAERVL